MPNPAEKAVDSGKEIATKKAGPLPVWGWALVVVGVGGVAYYVFMRGSGDSAAARPAGGLVNGIAGGLTGGGGSGGGAGSSGSAPPPPIATGPAVSALTNNMWLERAVAAVESSIPGLTPGVARLYLIDYLGGSAPQGSSASSAFSRVVAAAKQSVGEAPNPASSTNPNANPFTNNVSWLQAALGFSQNLGLSQTARNELTNLIYGTNTTISQEAATALSALRDLIGGEPLPVSFSLRAVEAPPASGGGGGPAAPPALPDFGKIVSQDRIARLIDVGARQYQQFGSEYGNTRSNYLNTWGSVFGNELDADQITRGAEAVKAAFRARLIDPNNLDRDQFRQIILDAIGGHPFGAGAPAQLPGLGTSTVGYPRPENR